MIRPFLSALTLIVVAALSQAHPVDADAGVAAVFAPNANLFTQGIPPIPQALVDRVPNTPTFAGIALSTGILSNARWL